MRKDESIESFLATLSRGYCKRQRQAVQLRNQTQATKPNTRNSLILACTILGLLAAMTHSASAQNRAVSLPANAQEIEPGVYHIGRVKDRAGRDVDGIAFVHSRQLEARPGGGGGGGPKTDPCYSLLGADVRWKTVEDYVVSPSIANAADGVLFMEQIEAAIANWEAAAGTDIFGSPIVGDVDLDLIGNAPNGVNEITFAFIQNPSTLAFCAIWGVFTGPPGSREFTEWDIVCRNDVAWSTTEPYPGYHYDLWNCAAHELGHAAGLGHPSDTCTEETMYRFISAGETKKQTLEAGDLAGIAEKYQ